MPRWVKVFIAIGALFALGFVVTMLAGVDHGPGLHRPPGAERHDPVGVVP